MCDVTPFTLTHRTTCLYLICYALDDAGNVIKVKCVRRGAAGASWPCRVCSLDGAQLATAASGQAIAVPAAL